MAGGMIGAMGVAWEDGKGGEVCEELRKRMIDVYCFLEVRQRGQGARMLGMEEGDISCGYL